MLVIKEKNNKQSIFLGTEDIFYQTGISSKPGG